MVHQESGCIMLCSKEEWKKEAHQNHNRKAKRVVPKAYRDLCQQTQKI